MVPNTVLAELKVLSHKLACVLVHAGRRAVPNVPHVQVSSTSALQIDSEGPRKDGEARMVSKVVAKKELRVQEL